MQNKVFSQCIYRKTERFEYNWLMVKIITHKKVKRQTLPF